MCALLIWLLGLWLTIAAVGLVLCGIVCAIASVIEHPRRAAAGLGIMLLMWGFLVLIVL